jgi:hypothetical protein
MPTKGKGYAGALAKRYSKEEVEKEEEVTHGHNQMLGELESHAKDSDRHLKMTKLRYKIRKNQLAAEQIEKRLQA